MRAVNNPRYPILLCTLFFLGAQLSLALNPTSSVQFEPDVSDSTELRSFQNERFLETVTTPCSTMFCTQSNSIQNQTSALAYVISFGRQSKITLQIQVGKPATGLKLVLSSSPSVPMVTTFSLSPSDSSQDVSVSYLSGANWNNPLSFGSSAYTSRLLIVTIENDSPSQSTTSTFTITVNNNDDDTTTTTTNSGWGSAIGGAIGGVIVVIVIVICIRKRRMRRMRRMRRRRSELDYQIQNIQQFPPQQQPGQPGQYQLQAQLQGSIIYQPINQNPPNYQMQQQPGNIQYVPVVADPNFQLQQSVQYVQVMADPNYQQQPGIQYIPIANYPQPEYQGQGIQLAPPMQMAMPVNPEEGPLSEMNFNHRFPEAPFQNFASSFPQKTCSICLEDLKRDQVCRQLYCEHIFHGECAKVWLLNQMVKQNHGYCPNCNKNMTFVLERAKS